LADNSRFAEKSEVSSSRNGKQVQQQKGKHHHSMRAHNSFNSRIKKDFARLSHDLGIGTSLGLNEVTNCSWTQK